MQNFVIFSMTYFVSILFYDSSASTKHSSQIYASYFKSIFILGMRSIALACMFKIALVEQQLAYMKEATVLSQDFHVLR